ncbi:MAG: putative ABC transporter permease [Lachnospiraceae bacterium]|nr:putative ABC transporter permease [Lachnospiraceae bacterium]
MWDQAILGVTIYYMTGFLILFSFLGWVWESSYVSVCEKRLANRGYVTGPVCTIYGVAATFAYIVLRPLEGRYLALFFAGVIISSVLEFVTASVMEAVFHTSWWDYTDKRFNYKGKVCLSASILWGLCAELLFTVMVPFYEWVTGLYTRRIGEALYTIIFVMYVIDFSLATIAAVDIGKQIGKLETMLDDLGAMIRSSKLYATKEEAVLRLSSLRHNLIGAEHIRRYSRRLEIRQAFWADQLKLLGIKETATDLIGRIKSSVNAFEESWAGAKLKISESRILKAYPRIKSQERLKEEIEKQDQKDRKEG